MTQINKHAFSNGMRDGIPIATGYFAVSFTLGIAAKNAGFTPLQAMIVSMTNNALDCLDVHTQRLHLRYISVPTAVWRQHPNTLNSGDRFLELVSEV